MVVINSTAEFEKVCKENLLLWYRRNYPSTMIGVENVFVVWLSKNLQNYKAILSTNKMDGIMAEYSYNGDKQELYEDVYKKLTNRAIRE